MIDVRKCAPIHSAAVDIWHCDAGGLYSDEASNGTSGQTYLRGVQLTNRKGFATFRTIYPGHYTGRATHIHMKVHIGGKARGGTLRAGHVSHTGQLFFADSDNSSVYSLSPYSSDTAQRTLNASDSIYSQAGGRRAQVSLKGTAGPDWSARSSSAFTRKQDRPRSENLSPMRAMIFAAGLGTRLAAAHLRDAEAGRAGAEPADRRLDRRPDRRPRLRAGGRQPLLSARADPGGARRRLGFRPRITYSDEPEPLGTAGGVGKVRDFLSETDSFLIISGDALTDIDLSAMREAHETNVERGAIATLATKRVEDTTQFGVVITDEDGRIQGFQEKPEPAEALSDLANCGIYMFRAEIFDHFPPPDFKSPAGDDDQPPGFVDWAMDVFPALLDGDIPFYSHEIDAYWNDIGSVASSSRETSTRSRARSGSSPRPRRSPRASTPATAPTWTA